MAAPAKPTTASGGSESVSLRHPSPGAPRSSAKTDRRDSESERTVVERALGCIAIRARVARHQPQRQHGPQAQGAVASVAGPESVTPGPSRTRLRVICQWTSSADSGRVTVGGHAAGRQLPVALACSDLSGSDLT